MAGRTHIAQAGRRILSNCSSRPTTWQNFTLPIYQRQQMATVVAPPVTHNSTSSQGPTAMVFMNMGGPSTTDEVNGFLSRLFVRMVLVDITIGLTTVG